MVARVCEWMKICCRLSTHTIVRVMQDRLDGAVVLAALQVALCVACEPSETGDTGPVATSVATGDGDPSGSGDGDGDEEGSNGDGDPSGSGDGDGDPSSGDGDGDPSSGDGDGDPGPADNACPEGLEGQVPTLQGLNFQLVATPPNDGFPDNGAFEILEGPVWIDGTLYVSHIAGGGPPPKSRILALVGGNLEEFWAQAGSNGLAVDPLGRMLVARHSDGSVSRIELDAPGEATPLVSSYEGQRFNSPNDLALSSAGHLYFSDPNWQAPNPNPQTDERAYYLLEGSGEAVAFASEVDKPNGVLLSLDESRVYVGGTGGLYAYALAEDGSAGSGTQVQGVWGGVDGMTKDCAGNLYLTLTGQVMVLDPGHQMLGTLNLPEVTNLAFGGPDRRTLYATTLQDPGLHAVELDIPGFAY